MVKYVSGIARFYSTVEDSTPEASDCCFYSSPQPNHLSHAQPVKFLSNLLGNIKSYIKSSIK